MTVKTHENEKLLYSIPEAAKLLGSNADYVRELVKSGILPSMKAGRVKISRKALEEFVDRMNGMDITNPYNPMVFDCKALT